MGGSIHELILGNTGSVARYVNIDCGWKSDKAETSKNILYAPSLDKSQEISLTSSLREFDLEKVRQDKGFVKIVLTYQDVSGRNLSETQTIDFKKLEKQKRTLTMQVSPLYAYLEEIARNTNGLKTR